MKQRLLNALRGVGGRQGPRADEKANSPQPAATSGEPPRGPLARIRFLARRHRRDCAKSLGLSEDPAASIAFRARALSAPATPQERRRRQRAEALRSSEPPAIHVPSLARALQALLGRPCGGEFDVESDVFARGRGLATGYVVRRTVFEAGGTEPLARLVEKELVDAPGEADKIVWHREALFYADRELHQRFTGVRPPRCHEVYVAGAKRILVYIEDLGDYAKADLLDAHLRVARSFGRFAGRCHAESLWERDWLVHTRRAISIPGGLPAEPEGLALFVESDAERRAIRDSFNRLFSHRRPLAGLIAGLPQTISHMDAHLNNVMLDPAAAEDVVAIDWARVSRGFIGEDAAKLSAPWRALVYDRRPLDETLRREREFFDAYVAAAREEAPDLDAETIETGIAVRQALLTAARLQDPGGLRKRMAKLGEDERAACAGYLYEVRARVDSLCSRLK